MFKIKKIIGREIIDSRGIPTLEVEMFLSSGISAYASVPSGASKGKHEAIELRDEDERYNGNGLKKVINIIQNIIEPQLINKSFSSIAELDNKLIEMDGSDNKSKLGSNTTLALSLSFSKCVAKQKQKKLFEVFAEEYGIPIGNEIQFPIPMFNLINGGKHANNNLMIQEFMVVPIMQPDTLISERIRMGCEFFADLKNLLERLNISTNVGDEGGFAPNLNTIRDVLDLLMEVISKEKYHNNIKIAIDAAASTFYNNTLYYPDEKIALSSQEIVQYYGEIISKYPIMSIEDGMCEGDIPGWKMITQNFSKKIMVVGDDLFVTSAKKLQYGIDNNLANAILIKPNQVGTITETLDTIRLAKKYAYEVIVSHRSGETEDTSLSHLAIGVGAKYIKSGAISRSERVAKYNELIRISNSIYEY